MAWNFTFQGVREDAIAALNAFNPTSGPGHADHFARVKPLIVSELQAMNPGQVSVISSGKWSAGPPPTSTVSIRVQQRAVVNNTVLSPANPPPAN